VVARITCPRDGHVSSSGDISYGRSLFPDITVEPIDFQGLDSRFSRAPVRTTLTGIFHHPFRLFFLIDSLFDLGLAYEYDHDDMASPHRLESFFHDGPASPSILLVSIGDGDSFDVVLGPVLTLVRSEEGYLEQESPFVVEPVGDEPLLIEGGPFHVSSSPDRQPLVTTDGAVSSELTDSQVEDLTEQAAIDYDYELDESWLEEQLLVRPEAEVLTSEGLVEAHVSPCTSYFLCRLLVAYFSMYLCLLFYFIAGFSAPAGPPEATDIPISTPIPPISGDEAIGRIFSSFIFSLVVIGCLTSLFYCRCHNERLPARF
jgi:hypothetical protein